MLTSFNIVFDDQSFLYAHSVSGAIVVWHAYSEMPSELLSAIYIITEGSMLDLPNLAAEWFDRQ